MSPFQFRNARQCCTNEPKAGVISLSGGAGRRHVGSTSKILAGAPIHPLAQVAGVPYFERRNTL
jgi:hypothetical protein